MVMFGAHEWGRRGISGDVGNLIFLHLSVTWVCSIYEDLLGHTLKVCALSVYIL